MVEYTVADRGEVANHLIFLFCFFLDLFSELVGLDIPISHIRRYIGTDELGMRGAAYREDSERQAHKKPKAGEDGTRDQQPGRCVRSLLLVQ